MVTTTRFKQILPLLVLVALVLPAIAEEVGDPLVRYKGIPAYCLIIDAACPDVNGGDDFDVKFYISGAGDVSHSEISVTVPSELLIKDKNISYTYMSDVTDDGHIKQSKTETKEPRYRLRLNPECYKRYIRNDRPLEEQIPILIGEVNYESRPAFSINFTIADNAPAGDYVITISHYYNYLDKWYLDKNELKVHVNTWYEKDHLGYSILSWQSIAIWLTVLTILITLINQSRDLVSWIRAYFRGLF
ncbi:hypothetical protein [Methanocrinis sp.]|uniref:hypothetical protein n=1 Tax=Methanocrinis sp. TaxID=3101522 RepID=UPI003D0B3F57